LQSYGVVAKRFADRGIDPVLCKGNASETLTGYAGGVIKSVHEVDRWVAAHRFRLFKSAAPTAAAP